MGGSEDLRRDADKNNKIFYSVFKNEWNSLELFQTDSQLIINIKNTKDELIKFIFHTDFMQIIGDNINLNGNLLGFYSSELYILNNQIIKTYNVLYNDEYSSMKNINNTISIYNSMKLQDSFYDNKRNMAVFHFSEKHYVDDKYIHIYLILENLTFYQN